jgi:hypothetical protein
MAPCQTELYARPVVGFVYSLVHTCKFSCNVTVNGTDPAAWQPRASMGPQNLQILKYVAASFGLDSILLKDVAILEPCQQDTEIASLIRGAPNPDKVIHATINSVIRYKHIHIM